MADRTIKELLQLILDRVNNVNWAESGLCTTILRTPNLAKEEKGIVFDYLRENLPKKDYTKDLAYKWKPGTKACRIKWLNKQINSL